MQTNIIQTYSYNFHPEVQSYQMDLTNIAARISEAQQAANMTEPITDNEEILSNTTMQFVFCKIGTPKTVCCWKESLKPCFMKGRNTVTLFGRSLRFKREQTPSEEVVIVFMPARACLLWTNILQNLSFFIFFLCSLPFSDFHSFFVSLPSYCAVSSSFIFYILGLILYSLLFPSLVSLSLLLPFILHLSLYNLATGIRGNIGKLVVGGSDIREKAEGETHKN